MNPGMGERVQCVVIVGNVCASSLAARFRSAAAIFSPPERGAQMGDGMQ